MNDIELGGKWVALPILLEIARLVCLMMVINTNGDTLQKFIFFAREMR